MSLLFPIKAGPSRGQSLRALRALCPGTHTSCALLMDPRGAAKRIVNPVLRVQVGRSSHRGIGWRTERARRAGDGPAGGQGGNGSTRGRPGAARKVQRPTPKKVCLKGSKSGVPMTKANDTDDPTRLQLGFLLLQILTFGSRRVQTERCDLDVSEHGRKETQKTKRAQKS